MKGFILAAGNGTRLMPLTLQTPKPLLHVGVTPIINYLIYLFLKHDISDIKVGIQKKDLGSFCRWRDTYYPRQRIELVAEEAPSGTFTPIYNLSERWFNEPIVVSNGDELKDIDIDQMIRWHLRRRHTATVGLIRVNNPCDYGVARLKGKTIIEFIEKPEVPPSPYINSGIYVLNPEIRNYYPGSTKFAMLETVLFPELAKERKLHGYKLSGRWMDTGTFQRLEQAMNDWDKDIDKR